MSPEQLKELQAELQKSIGDGVKALETKIGEDRAAATKEIEGLKSQLKEVSEKLAKLEAMPALDPKKIREADRTKNVYRGYKIHKQNKKLREMAGKSPEKFETFSDEEQIDNFSKFMIDFVGATKRVPDMECVKAMAEVQAACKTTMNETTASQGGYIVPTEYQWDLIQLNKDRTFALRECNVVPMSSDQKLWPTELTRAAMAWKAESASLAQSDPTFGQVALNSEKLTGMSWATNEMIQDAAIDVAGILTDQFSYGTALELDNQVLNGTGSPCSGVLTAAAGFSTVMSTGLSNFSSISFDNLSNMIDQVPEGYDEGGIFVFNKRIKHFLRTLKDSQNRYLLVDPGGVAPGTLWEQRYVLTSQSPKTTGASTAFVTFGNFKYFFIGQRLGSMTIDVDPYGRFDTYETRFRMVTRWALKIAVANAFSRLITAA